MRRGWWPLVVFFAAIVSAYAAAALLVPPFRPPLVRARLAVIPWAVSGHISGGALALFWRIRRGDQIGHRRWMLRSYAFTFAAVTLRIYLPIALTAGLPFIDAYQTISWACWVPNLIVVEWWLLQPARPIDVARSGALSRSI